MCTAHRRCRAHTAQKKVPTYVYCAFQWCSGGSLLYRQQGSQFWHPLLLHMCHLKYAASSRAMPHVPQGKVRSNSTVCGKRTLRAWTRKIVMRLYWFVLTSIEQYITRGWVLRTVIVMGMGFERSIRKGTGALTKIDKLNVGHAQITACHASCHRHSGSC
jgi:hypothetical protein